MNSRTVELEIVQYKTNAISQATNGLIQNFADYSDIGGTRNWLQLWGDIMNRILNQSPANCLWEANGMDINFSFFLEPLPRIKDGELVYSPSEPRISFIERPESVRPAVRTHIGKVTDEIVREMEDVYHLRVETRPFVLTFPNREYARRVDKFRVPLLQS